MRYIRRRPGLDAEPERCSPAAGPDQRSRLLSCPSWRSGAPPRSWVSAFPASRSRPMSRSRPGERIANRGALNMTDFLAREFAGINLTHVQNNPFQPDFSYRGFTSSFLIGTPPGLSVFVDGVRANEPLADQVNWDLIPTDAIDRIELLPGSNPVYGRNTLGGTLVMQTKRGFNHPGTSAEIWGGSFGRLRTLLQSGGHHGKFDYFMSGNFFLEDGFRDFSDGHVGNVFGKLGYLDDVQDANLSLTWVNNRLTGNGPLPESRLKRDRSAVFTHPDRFQPTLWLVNGNYRRTLSPQLTLSHQSVRASARRRSVQPGCGRGRRRPDQPEKLGKRRPAQLPGPAVRHAADRHRRC